jgi:TrpR-related protein YerC/YecD
MANITEEMLCDLYETLISLDNIEDCKLFLKDLCTHKEVENMAQRICAAKLLMQGETYLQVTEKTGIASATLARVSDALKYGEGYKKILKK